MCLADFLRRPVVRLVATLRFLTGLLGLERPTSARLVAILRFFDCLARLGAADFRAFGRTSFLRFGTSWLSDLS